MPSAPLATDQWIWQERFSYDRRGNRTAVQNGWGGISYSYDTGNRLLQAGERRYTHDPDGNLTRELLDTRDLRYRYNGRDRVVEASGELLAWTDEGPQASFISYSYDALGRRARREATFRAGGAVGHDAIEYLYDGRSFDIAEELRDIAIPPGLFSGPQGGPASHPGRGRGRPEEFPGPDWLTPPPWQTDDPGTDPQEIAERSVREYLHANGELLSHTDLVTRPAYCL